MATRRATGSLPERALFLELKGGAFARFGPASLLGYLMQDTEQAPFTVILIGNLEWSPAFLKELSSSPWIAS